MLNILCGERPAVGLAALCYRGVRALELYGPPRHGWSAAARMRLGSSAVTAPANTTFTCWPGLHFVPIGTPGA